MPNASANRALEVPPGFPQGNAQIPYFCTLGGLVEEFSDLVEHSFQHGEPHNIGTQNRKIAPRAAHRNANLAAPLGVGFQRYDITAEDDLAAAAQLMQNRLSKLRVRAAKSLLGASRETSKALAINSAGVAELADAQDLGSCGRKAVGVQIPPSAPLFRKPLSTR
jgi:hypothetical protein